ncbi:hypothetical protein CC80DRAFT_594294 [Byssothecium circinans]|uniref:Uncharacterized protein n=1 Tax=Byssothecium circinans TaxID=147558 RepID=A0A6A5TUX6_9PLEO|nr:hypothetical protein CC80DRAFT_594294 [Byssothecium circinans]
MNELRACRHDLLHELSVVVFCGQVDLGAADDQWIMSAPLEEMRRRNNEDIDKLKRAIECVYEGYIETTNQADELNETVAKLLQMEKTILERGLDPDTAHQLKIENKKLKTESQTFQNLVESMVDKFKSFQASNTERQRGLEGQIASQVALMETFRKAAMARFGEEAC